MSSTAFIEPLPVIDFVTQLLNRDVSSRPLSDSDRVKVRIYLFFWSYFFYYNSGSSDLVVRYMPFYKTVTSHLLQFL
jgi:hypothetical protein